MATSRTRRKVSTPARVRTPTPGHPLNAEEIEQLRRERLYDEMERSRTWPADAFAHRGPFCTCHEVKLESRARGALCEACSHKKYTLQTEAQARGETPWTLDFDTLLRADRGRHPQRIWLVDLVDYRYESQYRFPLTTECIACHGLTGLALERPIVVAGQTVRDLAARAYPDIVLAVALMAHADITRRRVVAWGSDGNRYLLPRLCCCTCEHQWEPLPGGRMSEHPMRCKTCGLALTIDSSD